VGGLIVFSKEKESTKDLFKKLFKILIKEEGKNITSIFRTEKISSHRFASVAFVLAKTVSYVLR
jgi:hypothetical protein